MDRPRDDTPRLRRRGLGLAAALLALLAAGWAYTAMEPAVPNVDSRTLLVGEASRGPLVIEVRGPGTLVPEKIRWITALTAGRVEQRLVDPGQAVSSDTVILELSNPDVQLEALHAKRQHTAARAELLDLRTRLEQERLDQLAALASVKAEHQASLRQARATKNLAAENMVSQLDAHSALEHAEEMEARHDVERKRLKLLESTLAEKVSLQEMQVERLREIVEFQEGRVASMTVRAGASGILQDTDLEIGQWVQPGATLGKVAEPQHLKAVLKIPETLAKDMSVGQPAVIDTRNGRDGFVRGRVFRIDPAVQNGAVRVHVRLPAELPKGVRPDLSVEGVIEVAKLVDVMSVRRPAYSQAHSTLAVFVLSRDGRGATRTQVRLGRASADSVEVLEGLGEGDRIIVSDMSRWSAFDRVEVN
jgi:multidrug efflux pump subunit AcrA (membrane-fusion protein)